MKTQQLIYKNLLLISGTGRKTGKTSLACDFIRQMAHLNFTAIKMAGHFYEQPNMELFKEVPYKYQIFRESASSRHKDSSRMLAAGAKEVFYIQADTESAFDAFHEIYPLIPAHVPVLCESGGLGRYLTPSLHVVMTRLKPHLGDKTIDYLPDVFVKMNGTGYSLPLESFSFERGEWDLRR